MHNNTTIPLSSAMQTLIDEAYRLFGRYPAPQTLNICTGCCVSRKDEQALLTTPVHDIPFRLLLEYNSSAKDSIQDAGEIRHLLPRLLELVAQGYCPAISEELCLERVGNAQPERWPQKEQDFIARFAKQYIEDTLQRAETNGETIELDEAIIMFDGANVDIAPLLDAALEYPGFYSAASLAYTLIMKRSQGVLDNAFASGNTQLNKTIKQWTDASKKRLHDKASNAMLNLPENFPSLGEQTGYGTSLRFWIEESLCAVYDGCIN